ncbi:hypothetical protein PGTUg99_012962 [Puccinia graminis f. sp. tritici]|uniref:CN hydrolase domain-containing protein n=1 Tax=Puccinia graminis f. sp. tritici TaxID=56615 RepID=A0A5B0REM2_PUCGR|nr:hypothetical protein PGTUg99_012962 [Puccinia graminis f. sp. tritici]
MSLLLLRKKVCGLMQPRQRPLTSSASSIMPTKIRIAICQFDSHQPSTTTTTTTPNQTSDNLQFAEHEIKNLSKAKEFIARAAQNTADLIIFPEYFITGIIENHLHLASKESKWIKEFQRLAIEHQIDIIPGTIVEEEEEDKAAEKKEGADPTKSPDDRRVNLFNSYAYPSLDPST